MRDSQPVVRDGLAWKLGWSVFVLWHARREWRLPYWPPARLEALQSRRLRAIVAHAFRTVPFYRDVARREDLRPEDFRSADDLVRLPVVRRQQLADEPERFNSDAYGEDEIVTCLTTGTSGINRSIRYDHAAAFMSLACGHRSRLVNRTLVGKLRGTRQIEFGSALSSAIRLRSLYERLSWMPKRLDFERVHAPATGSLEEHVARFRQVRPHVVGGYGVYVGSLFRSLRQSDPDFHRPALVLFWGEGMPEADRELIEVELGIPVRGSYTATEALRLAWECEQRRGYHVDVDMVAIRVVDGAGRDLPPGRPGDLLVSNLTNRATVLLNYRLGDVVAVSPHVCPCGRTLPLLTRVEGRSDDLVLHPDGYPIHVWAVLAGAQSLPGVVNVQLVQSAPTVFHVRLVVGAGADHAAVPDQARQALRQMLGPAADITVETVEAIPPEPGGKVKLLVSSCRP